MSVYTNTRMQYSTMMAQVAAARTTGAKAAQTSKPDTGFSVDIEVDIDIGISEIEQTPQTIDDVKKEFYEYLDSLPISPGLSRTPLSVNITEAAFEKMLADPEYKQKMKDLCARDLCDPNWVKLPPSAINITIDADCGEEYLATSWNAPDAGKNANSDGFWTRRTEKNKADQKAQTKRAQEKREMMQFLQERADERKRLSKRTPLISMLNQGTASYVSSSHDVAGAMQGVFGA